MFTTGFAYAFFSACGSAIASFIKFKLVREYVIDTLRAKASEILGSTSPLNLNPLRYLSQRWFSPQALTSPLPEGSCITAKFDC